MEFIPMNHMVFSPIHSSKYVNPKYFHKGICSANFWLWNHLKSGLFCPATHPPLCYLKLNAKPTMKMWWLKSFQVHSPLLFCYVMLPPQHIKPCIPTCVHSFWEQEWDQEQRTTEIFYRAWFFGCSVASFILSIRWKVPSLSLPVSLSEVENENNNVQKGAGSASGWVDEKRGGILLFYEKGSKNFTAARIKLSPK